MSVNLYSSYDLDDMALKEQKFFIDGLLPEGLSFIAGPPKFGKTYLNLQLAVSVASGEEFLGRAVLNPCNVLYLYLEGDAAQVKQRLHDIYGEGRRFPRGLYFVHEIQSLSEGGLGELFRIVTDYDIRLVIIDTWQLVRGEATLRGTAYQREYNELTSLRNELYGKLGVSVLLTHHTKQIISGKHVDDLHMLNGSSALSGCADAVLLITGKRGKGTSAPVSFIRDPPKKLPKPIPKVVMASPVTFWLAQRVTVRKQYRSPIKRDPKRQAKRGIRTAMTGDMAVPEALQPCS